MGQNLNMARLLIELASNCDGARTRDGRGFSRSHAHDGARLAAMARQGIAWSKADLKTATSLIACYSIQAGKLLAPKSPDKARKLSALFRSGRLEPGIEVATKEAICPYMVMSEDRTMVHLYLTGSIDRFDDLIRMLSGMQTLSHGQRKIVAILAEKRDYHVNQKLKTGRRWEVSLNNTTRPILKTIASEFGVAIDPAITHDIDEEYDHLLRHKYAAYMQRSDTEAGPKWFVIFDVAEWNPAFLKTIKSQFKGMFRCKKADSGNWRWTVPLKRSAFSGIEQVIEGFHFSIDSRLKNFLEKIRRHDLEVKLQ